MSSLLIFTGLAQGLPILLICLGELAFTFTDFPACLHYFPSHDFCSSLIPSFLLLASVCLLFFLQFPEAGIQTGDLRTSLLSNVGAQCYKITSQHRLTCIPHVLIVVFSFSHSYMYFISFKFSSYPKE